MSIPDYRSTPRFKANASSVIGICLRDCVRKQDHTGNCRNEVDEQFIRDGEALRETSGRAFPSTLPKCPLCGCAPFRNNNHSLSCNDKACVFWGVALTESAWRRLAAPPLPPTVVALLRAADEYTYSCSPEDDLALVEATIAWAEASRPGMPEKP